MPATLDPDNLFVVPLDDRRQWYRYHHLSADVLGSRVLLEQPDRVPALHSAASGCYQRNGFAEAVRHALAAEDFDGPAGLRSVSRESLDEVHVGTASGRSPRGSARHRHTGGGTSTLDRATRDAAAGVAGVPGHFVRSVWRVTLGDVREVVAQGVHHNRAAVGVGEVGEGQGVGDGRE
jgi:hypothetical protein